MTKKKFQIAIIIAGLLACWPGINSLLHVSTIILPPWFLVILYVPIVLLISFLLGLLTKKILKSGWHTLTFTTTFAGLLSLIFYFSEYRPNYQIKVPEDFAGEVRLFVTKESKNDFNINKFGVGYVNKKTYKNGFQPTVLKGTKDITKEIQGYATGSFGTTSLSNILFDYISFVVPGKIEIEEDANNVDELIKSNGLDTARLPRK